MTGRGDERLRHAADVPHYAVQRHRPGCAAIGRTRITNERDHRAPAPGHRLAHRRLPDPVGFLGIDAGDQNTADALHRAGFVKPGFEFQMRHHQVAQYRADAAELRPPQRIGFHGPLGCRQELPARIDQSLGGGDEHVPTLAMDAFHVGQELLGGKRTLRQIDQVRRLTLPLAGQRRGGRHPPSVAAHRLDDLHGIGCADGFSVQPRLPDRDPQPACHARMSRAVIDLDQVIVDRFRNRDRAQVVPHVRG